MKKSDLSKFDEEATRWRALDRLVQSIKDRNSDVPPEELQAQIDETVRAVRAAKRKATATG